MKLGVKIFIVVYCAITFLVSVVAVARSFPIEKRSEEIITSINKSPGTLNLNSVQMADIDLQNYIITSMKVVRFMGICIFVSSSIIIFLFFGQIRMASNSK
jgi:hypothetical protein